MKKIFKGLGLGFITLALILVGGVQVSADLTVAALAVTSSAAITVSSTTASAATFDSGTTGAVNIGTGASAKTVTVGNATTTTALALNSGTGDMTLTSTDDVSILGGSAGSIINIGTNVDGNAINVGTDNTAADTIVIGSALDTSSLAGIAVTVGSTGTTSALTLQSGTGDVTVTSTDDFIFTATDDITISGNSAAGILNLGTGNDGFAINVGTDNTAADTIIVGSALDNVDLAGEDIALTSADDIHILGGSAGSIINIGTNVDGNAINVGTDNTAADTIMIGSALDNVDLAGEDIALTSADDIHILGGSAGSIINIGTNVDGNAINVGTDNTAADTIVIGSALDTSSLLGISVTVGSAGTTSALALNSGTGDMTLTSVDDISILGGSAGSIINIGTNVDGNAINVGTDNTAADTIVIGSALDTSSLAGIAVTVGSTGTTSALTLQSGTGDVTVTSTDDFIFTATDDITISGNSAAGILNLGTGNDGFAINVGTDNTAADTIIVGSALDNVDLAGEDIALTSADDIHILGGSAGSIINIGTNVDGNAINVGTDNTAADTIVIGSALDTSSLLGIAVTVGSTETTSALTLQSGTGDVTVTSTDDFIFTATDDITISGNSAAGILNLGTGNDGFAINVGTDNTAADTIIIGSALDNVDLAGEDIALTSADDIHILGGSAGSIINIGTNVDGNAINVGTDNTAADTIVIGSALDTSSLLGI